jgi:hypothetical protein
LENEADVKGRKEKSNAFRKRTRSNRDGYQ